VVALGVVVLVMPMVWMVPVEGCQDAKNERLLVFWTLKQFILNLKFLTVDGSFVAYPTFC
jgi:hypothetical protein